MLILHNWAIIKPILIQCIIHLQLLITLPKLIINNQEMICLMFHLHLKIIQIIINLIQAKNKMEYPKCILNKYITDLAHQSNFILHNITNSKYLIIVKVV